MVTSQISRKWFEVDNAMVTSHVVTLGLLKWDFEGGCGRMLRRWVFVWSRKKTFMKCWCYRIANEIPDAQRVERIPESWRHWGSHMSGCRLEWMWGYLCHGKTRGYIAERLSVRRRCVRLALLSVCSTAGWRHVELQVFALNILSRSSIVCCCGAGNTIGTVSAGTWHVQTCVLFDCYKHVGRGSSFSWGSKTPNKFHLWTFKMDLKCQRYSPLPLIAAKSTNDCRKQ